jgi:phytanoyl-CoA hydroxylase
VKQQVIKYIKHEASVLKRSFETDGFVSLPDFLAPSELTELRTQVARFLREVLPRLPASRVYYEDLGDPGSLKQVQELGEHDIFFRELGTRGAILRLAEVLLGEPVTLQNIQYFNKPPGRGLATPPHQDGAYFPITPNKAVTMWLALEDVAEDQGCIHYARGSARGGLLEHLPSSTLGFSRHVPGFDADQAEVRAFPCRGGHLVAHHSLTVHWCGPNRHADRGREAIGFIFFAASCRHDEHKALAYQSALKEGLERGHRI